MGIHPCHHGHSCQFVLFLLTIMRKLRERLQRTQLTNGPFAEYLVIFRVTLIIPISLHSGPNKRARPHSRPPPLQLDHVSDPGFSGVGSPPKVGTTPENLGLPMVYLPTGGGLERRSPGRGLPFLAYSEALIDVLHSRNSNFSH